MNLHVIVLAAGKGTRMRSDLPKVMHQLGGRPLLGYVLDTVQSLAPAAVHVVYGHGGEKVRAHFADAGVNWIEQTEQLGTGHAVTQGMTAVDPDATVLVVYGDVPLIRGETLAQLVETCGGTRFAMLTTRLDDPTGYGRVMRNDDHVVGVVEERDADPASARSARSIPASSRCRRATSPRGSRNCAMTMRRESTTSPISSPWRYVTAPRSSPVPVTTGSR